MSATAHLLPMTGGLVTEFEYFDEMRTVVIRGRGELAPELLDRWLRELIEDPRFDLSMHQVFDLRDVTGFPRSMADMERYIGIGAGFNRGSGRVALIADGQLMFGLARMFEAAATLTLSRDMAIFHSLEEAFDWLQATSDA